MTTAERIDRAKLFEALARIEEKLDALQNTPQEVIDLRRAVDARRREEQLERENWRDTLYRLLTSAAGLVKPKGPKQNLENCGNIPLDDHELK